jgi:hypothetical protein
MDSNDQGILGGAVQGGVVYASADFPDVESRVNTSNVVSNLILYHVSDPVEKQSQHRTWRRKIREILQNHQEKILQFFIKPLTDEHPLKYAHTLLTKYGKQVNTDITRQSPYFFKEYIVHSPQTGFINLNVYLNELSEKHKTETPIQKWLLMSRHMLDYMRDTGDELIRLDQKLQLECQRLDSVVEKVSQLVALPDPQIEGFKEMMNVYIEKQFEIHEVESLYWDYIFTLQKYSALREILIPQRISNQSEPICCICMTEPIVMALGPCGHTFCTNCSKRTLVCHICRQPVTTRLRIFFG